MGLQTSARVPSYLVYTALLAQAGTDVPAATVLENTLGGTVVWARSGVASYSATLAGAFPAGRVLLPPTQIYSEAQNGDLLVTRWVRAGANAVALDTYNLITQAGQEMEASAAEPVRVEIRVYPA